MTVTNVELQSQIHSLDKKVDERHEHNTKLLDDIGKKMDTLIELNLGQKLQAQMIGQIGEKMREQDESIKKFYGRLSASESSIKVHAWMWKIFSGVVVICLPAAGWMLVQVKDFYEQFNHDENRISTLEFLVQGRTTPVLAPAQTTSGSK